MRRVAIAVMALAIASAGTSAARSAQAPSAPDSSDHLAAPADGVSRDEPAVAVSPRDPQRVVTAAMALTSEYYIGVNTSHDGGHHFVEHRMPHGAGSTAQADPSLSFDARGSLYAGYLSFDRASRGGAGLVVVRSDDGGDTWPKAPTVVSHNVTEPNHCSMEDFPSFAADPRVGHSEVYVAWQRVVTTGSDCSTHVSTTVMWSVSRDRGRTWAAARPVPTGPGLTTYLPTITAGPDGAVVITSVAYATSGALVDATLACPSATLPMMSSVAVSRDGARSFGPAHSAQSFCSPGLPVSVSDPVLGASASSYTGSTVRLAASTNTVVDPRSGRLVNVASGQDPHTGQQLAYVASSSDGASWAPGGVVGVLPSENQQYPRLAAGANGHLSLLYVAQLPGGLLQATHAVSLDDGRSWSAPERLAALPARTVAPYWLGFMGDYVGNAVGSDGLAHPVWTDLRQSADPRADAFEGGQIYTKAVRS